MRRRETHEWFFELGADVGRLTHEFSEGSKLVRGKLWEPKVDVLEDGFRIVIRAEIAGVKGENLALTYLPERHSLLLRGSRAEQGAAPGAAAHLLEVYYGEFEREVELPEADIDVEAIRAEYRNGFLTVIVPKT